jgi:cation:H+ antiporter
MLESVLLVAGIALLIIGADIFVGASVGIAKKLQIPAVIIGLTVVAMGTGTPEAVISITASLQGANSLAISNVVGSNIFNLIFIIGFCSMIRAIPFKASKLTKDFLLSIIAAVILIGMMLLGGSAIPRWGSLFLLIGFIAYIVVLVLQALKSHREEERNPEETPITKPLPLIILYAFIGCAMILVGGQLAVDNATKIAAALGVSERIIGLTVIAMGTSLPELVTLLTACKKGENEFAFGTIIGSNTFNIAFILGIAGLISPLSFERALLYDTLFLVFGSLTVLLFACTRKQISRREGLVMVLVYTVYMSVVIILS